MRTKSGNRHDKNLGVGVEQDFFLRAPVQTYEEYLSLSVYLGHQYEQSDLSHN